VQFKVVNEAKDSAAVSGMQVVVALLDDLCTRCVLDPFGELLQGGCSVANLPLDARAVGWAWARTQMSSMNSQIGWNGANEMKEGQYKRDGDLQQNVWHADPNFWRSDILCDLADNQLVISITEVIETQ
jgi:hypothetical protein